MKKSRLNPGSVKNAFVQDRWVKEEGLVNWIREKKKQFSLTWSISLFIMLPFGFVFIRDNHRALVSGKTLNKHLIILNEIIVKSKKSKYSRNNEHIKYCMWILMWKSLKKKIIQRIISNLSVGIEVMISLNYIWNIYIIFHPIIYKLNYI